MRRLKLAFIGCGNIASSHADVIRHLGHSIDIVVARKGSRNIESFAKKYRISKKVFGIDSFIELCGKSKGIVDGIIVVTPWNITENVLAKILDLGIPVMAEKPAVLSSKGFRCIAKKRFAKNLFVACNRKFYDFVPDLKKALGRDAPILVDVLSAEPYSLIVNRLGAGVGAFMPHYYTVHIADLLFSVFGDLKIQNITQVGTRSKRSWVLTLYSKKFMCPIQMKIIMDSPQNSFVKIFMEGKVFEMKPLEKMYLYDSIEKKGTKGNARYVPKIRAEYKTDARFKPGFLNQSRYFIKNFVLRKNTSNQVIQQLGRVVRFCDTLKNTK